MSADATNRRSVTLSVNRANYTLSLPARRTLLDVLREELALTGTKKVCDLGHCGACTVHRNGKAVLACITLAILCDGDEITTIEGLTPPGDELSKLQRAFIDHDGLQCGFCTPGQIMSAAALLAENSAPGEREVRQHMSGNLCRCGAYDGIIEAILSVTRGEAQPQE